MGLNPFNNYECDLATRIPQFDRQFDLVVHAAGDIRPEKSMSVNYEGTRNLCVALETAPPQQLVYISSVQVYGKTQGENYDETIKPAPITDYGKSKFEAEKFLKEWCVMHNVTLSILRPPMIIGTGMKGTLRAMVNGIYRGYYRHIKGCDARRSIIHAVDVASAVKRIAPVGGTFNITDRDNPTVHNLAEALAYRMGNKRIYAVSLKKARMLAWFGDKFSFMPFSSQQLSQLTETLTFNSDAISRVIDWQPHGVTNYLRTHNYDENSL